MFEWFTELAGEVARENAPWVVTCIVALIAFGMVIGAAKRLVSLCFTKFLDVGDTMVALIAQKPKSIVLVVVVLGIALPSAIWGYYYAPPKIERVQVDRVVKVPEPYAVQDEAEINRLRAVIQQHERDAAAMRGQASSAESRARSLEESLEASKRTIVILTRQKEEAAALIEKLAPPPPPEPLARERELEARREALQEESKSLLKEIHNAWKELDDLHYDGVQHDYKRVRNYQFFRRETVLNGEFLQVQRYFHRNCQICNHNFEVEKRVIAMKERRDEARAEGSKIYYELSSLRDSQEYREAKGEPKKDPKASNLRLSREYGEANGEPKKELADVDSFTPPPPVPPPVDPVTPPPPPSLGRYIPRPEAPPPPGPGSYIAIPPPPVPE